MKAATCVCSPTLSAALALARRGVKCFPFGVDRRPLPGQLRAQTEATTDADALVEAFTRWPDAALHALTGARVDGGLGVVIDVDGKNGKDGFAALLDLEKKISCPLPETATAGTPSGGVHLHFAWPAGVVIRNSDGVIGVGLDVKGARGSIVMPPTVKPSGAYRWTDKRARVEELPPAWVAFLREQPRPIPAAPRQGVTCGSAYCRAVLRGEADRIAAAAPGTRQPTCNTAAYVVGTVLHGGLSFDEAEARLGSAAESIADAGFTVATARATIRRALRDGAANPRTIPLRGSR